MKKCIRNHNMLCTPLIRLKGTWQIDEGQVIATVAKRLGDVVPAAIATTAMLL